ncbi:hypothetical protein ACIBCD_27050 [Nocardia brasiliensis]|uniref:hypothetical protein n=1 Tax=Nocardia brasiliensis TaxID=37326 RepID=UPI00379E5A92
MTEFEVTHLTMTAGEESRRLTEDLARYAGVRIMVAVDPDRPDALVNTVEIVDTAPCFAAVAAALHVIADEFQRRHDLDGCRVPPRPPGGPRDPGLS